jgi:hypothetical protein
MNDVFAQNRKRNKEFFQGKSFLSANEVNFFYNFVNKPSEVDNRLTLLEAMLFKCKLYVQ